MKRNDGGVIGLFKTKRVLKLMMMKNSWFLLFFILFFSSCNAQKKETTQTVAFCTEGKGCEFSELTLSASEVDRLLGESNFWARATPYATLILNKCAHIKEEKRTLAEIDQSYGGNGKDIVLKKMDIEKYLREKGCVTCPNATKKMSFYVQASGETEVSGNSYFYLNLKAGEAYMPNEAFHQLYGSEAGDIVVDQFIRNGKIEQYMIAEGKKYRHSMPIGTTISVIKEDAMNEKRFKTDFKKTGKTRKHPGTLHLETEHVGKDDDGNTIHFWIVPYPEVCLPKGKFDAFGFYNLGYISVDGITYLVTEISGAGFQLKLTGISDASYSFNPTGYQSY